MRLALLSLKPMAPALFYGAGLLSLTAAGFVVSLLVGLIALGAAFVVVGYMVEVNQ